VVHGRQPGYEWPCLLAVTAAVLLHERYRRAGGAFWPVVLAAAAAGLLGWFGLYGVLILLGASFLGPRQSRPGWAGRAALVAIPLAVAGLYAGYLAWLEYPLAERLAYFWARRGPGSLFGAQPGGEATVQALGIGEYLYTVQKHFVNHVTVVPLLLAAAWGWEWWRARRAGRALPEAPAVAMLLLFGLLCYAVTLRASYKHRFYVIWWTPALALAGGCWLARWREAAGAAERRAAWLRLAAAALLVVSALYKGVSYHRKEAAEAPLRVLHVAAPATPQRRDSSPPPKASSMARSRARSSFSSLM
jgi:hypothetical protein